MDDGRKEFFRMKKFVEGYCKVSVIKKHKIRFVRKIEGCSCPFDFSWFPYPACHIVWKRLFPTIEMYYLDKLDYKFIHFNLMHEFGHHVDYLKKYRECNCNITATSSRFFDYVGDMDGYPFNESDMRCEENAYTDGLLCTPIGLRLSKKDFFKILYANIWGYKGIEGQLRCIYDNNSYFNCDNPREKR